MTAAMFMKNKLQFYDVKLDGSKQLLANELNNVLNGLF